MYITPVLAVVTLATTVVKDFCVLFLSQKLSRGSKLLMGLLQEPNNFGDRANSRQGEHEGKQT